MRIIFFLILPIFLITACKEKSNLEAEVIAIHDEVMPKMGDIHVAKKQLRKLMGEGTSDSLKTEILELISDLEKADEGMMDWMDKWDVPSEEPAMTAYLEKEKIKITKVKEDMLNSIEAANAYLQKANQK